MQSTFKKIFSFHRNKSRLFTGILALFTGFIIMIFSANTYFYFINNFGSGDNKGNYIIVNKNVEMGNTLFNKKTKLTDKELSKLKDQDFIKDIGLFTSNQYQVWIYAHEKLNFGSELFFESIPNRFIDIKTKDWNWNKGKPYVPIIISGKFLNLYNFGYAISKGLPQLSRETAKNIPLKIKISGKNGSEKFNARIVGFSERIPSILVPTNFMQWANKKIANSSKSNPSRAIIQYGASSTQKMKQFFQKNKDLETGNPSLLESKAGVIIQSVIIFIAFTGIMFFLLAMLVLLLNFRIVISDKKQEVSLLLQIGYYPASISNLFFKRVSLLFIITSLMAFIVVTLANFIIGDIAENKGLEHPKIIYIPVLLFFSSLLLFTLMAIRYYINRWLKRIEE